MQESRSDKKKNCKDGHNRSECTIKIQASNFLCWENASIKYCISAITCYTVRHQLKRRMYETPTPPFLFFSINTACRISLFCFSRWGPCTNPTPASYTSTSAG